MTNRSPRHWQRRGARPMRRIPYADALAPRLAEFRGGGVVTGESLNDLACATSWRAGIPA